MISLSAGCLSGKLRITTRCPFQSEWHRHARPHTSPGRTALPGEHCARGGGAPVVLGRGGALNQVVAVDGGRAARLRQAAGYELQHGHLRRGILHRHPVCTPPHRTAGLRSGCPVSASPKPSPTRVRGLSAPRAPQTQLQCNVCRLRARDRHASCARIRLPTRSARGDAAWPRTWTQLQVALAADQLRMVRVVQVAVHHLHSPWPRPPSCRPPPLRCSMLCHHSSRIKG